MQALPILEDVAKALTPAQKRRVDVLRLNEIFYSVQGESSLAGERCVFVRLTGCGLRCSYCDTEYAFYEGRDVSIDEVAAAVASYNCPLVELTGGEPLEQEGAYPLMNTLIERGYAVMLETGGHVDIGRVPTAVKRIVDLKTPSSGMSTRNRFGNIQYLTSHDEIKFVIGSREDYEWSRDRIAEFDIASRVGTILMSPVWGSLEPIAIVNWILEDKLPVRFQLQLHKLIWSPSTRGV